ncbi:hypothetical protein P12x_003733 [Tundrisphaera lichenicola]|uniref:hypothetical protein n=1 Tax=Tundrisphaera lichenicola TaxID=2029860 RepID=UPI003EB9BD5D
MVGLSVGLADVHYSGDFNGTGYAYLLAGAVLGYRHAGRSWPCWLPLGLSLYVVHVAAIACGYERPFVEKDMLAARDTLPFALVAGIGIAIGASTRFLLAAFGWFRRAGEDPVRLLPRSTKGTMVAVAEFGITLGLIRWIAIDSGTIYSEKYNEARFQQIRVGMTSGQVEALIGRPLYTMDGSGEGNRTWEYSRGAGDTSSYWRRWVMMSGGKVEEVVNDYWWD